MVQRTGTMTVDDFIRLYRNESPFELIDGQIIPVALDVAGQSMVIKTVVAALVRFCETHKLGEVFLKCPYVLTDQQGIIFASRAADLIFYETTRWAGYVAATEGWLDKPFTFVPDLAAEVTAPTEREADIHKKGERYLADGVRFAWIIDPWRTLVYLYRGGRFETLSGDAVLTGGDILPGFSLPLADLFA